MTILEYIKQYGNIDHVVILLDSNGYTDEQITKLTGLSRTTIFNIRNRYRPLLEALRNIKK